MSLINTSKKNKDSCIGQNKTSRFKDTKSTPWLKSRATKFSYISGIFGKYSKSPHWYDKYQIKPYYISVLMLKMLDLESLAYWVQINPGSCKTGFDHIHGVFLAEFWPLTIKFLYYKTTFFINR